TPIIFLLFAITKIEIPIKGTKKIVTLCAKTINSNGNLPNDIATIQPNTITIEIRIFTFLELRLLPKPKASPNKAPPTVALPTNDEKDAPNKPTKNNELA